MAPKQRGVRTARLAAPLLAAALVAVAVGAASGSGSGAVRLELRFRTAGAGTFAMRGAISGAGRFTASQRVAAGRLTTTEVLVGGQGKLRIRVQRRCAAAFGTWKLVSGSGDFAGLTGGGTARGGPPCRRARYPVRAQYTGSLRVPDPGPPPPAAEAGHYGGATSQREEVTFDVDASGAAVTGFRMVVFAPCSGGQVSQSRIVVSVPGPLAVGRDKAFAHRVDTFWQGGLTGRFTSPTTAEGTADVKTTATQGSTTYDCAATVTWRASLPPPAARPGTYCGSTIQGGRICLDVAPGGREVSRVEVEVTATRLPDGQCELKLRFGASPIGANLGFSKDQTSFEGVASGRAIVTGFFDSDGVNASGRVLLVSAGIEAGGRRYACKSASANWTAKR
jgi:hypothetical protein